MQTGGAGTDRDGIGGTVMHGEGFLERSDPLTRGDPAALDDFGQCRNLVGAERRLRNQQHVSSWRPEGRTMQISDGDLRRQAALRRIGGE